MGRTVRNGGNADQANIMLAQTKRIPNTQVNVERIIFRGGLDLETNPLDLDPGLCILAENFQCAVNGGYERIMGYERFDGQTSPSSAIFYTLPATITGAWSIGDTLTGALSGSTAQVIGSTDTGFIITKPSANFTTSENLQISAVTVATCDNGAYYAGGGSSIEENAIFNNLAADEYRSDITAIPGSGDVLGVWIYNGDIYGFRNNAGSTACDMYKSTTSGWSQITFDNEISFNTGVGEIFVGDTVSGTSSSASADVLAVVRTSGTWGGTPSAAGILVLDTITGGPFSSGEALQVSAVTKATSTSVSSAITMAKDGRFQFVNYNFGGAEGTYKMYGCDGVNRAFEFDGTTLVPLATGMTSDAPKFIAAHKYHLFLAFGASLQHSGIGDPHSWDVVLGAGELALGAPITGVLGQAGTSAGSDASGALLATTTRESYTLYGNSSSDWNLVLQEPDAGALPYSLQKIAYSYCLDDRGIRGFGSTDKYGNFDQSTVSGQIKSWILERKPNIVDSMVHRESNQYRIFFSDKYAVYVSLENNRIIGMMPQFFQHDVTCSVSGELSNGVEGAFFGSSNGFVYQMEKGTSFDGDPISAQIKLAHNHFKSPTISKRYHRAALEISGHSYVQIDFTYELGYGLANISQPGTRQITSSLDPTLWDSFTWDAFYWDGISLAPSSARLSGSAENISLIISTRSEIAESFNISGAIIHWSKRRRQRL